MSTLSTPSTRRQVRLGHHSEPVALQALDHVHLPQRPRPIQPTGDHPADELAQLLHRAGSGQGRASDVKVRSKFSSSTQTGPRAERERRGPAVDTAGRRRSAPGSTRSTARSPGRRARRRRCRPSPTCAGVCAVSSTSSDTSSGVSRCGIAIPLRSRARPVHRNPTEVGHDHRRPRPDASAPTAGRLAATAIDERISVTPPLVPPLRHRRRLGGASPPCSSAWGWRPAEAPPNPVRPRPPARVPTAPVPTAPARDAGPGTRRPTPADRVVVDITIADGKVDPERREDRCRRGQEVELNVTSDVDDEIHAHTGGDGGYELEVKGRRADHRPVRSPRPAASRWSRITSRRSS